MIFGVNPSWVAHGFAEALTRAFLFLLPGRSRALERGAAPIVGWHLAGGDHAINAHRSDRSGGNVARPSRQPSRSNLIRAMPFITICTLPTWEMCVQEVIAGNRGFCSPNPYYRGPEVVPRRASTRTRLNKTRRQR
jgi:hypothetical protein